MKKIYFKSIKSACFMLFACLTLSICATSCSSDEFETNLPEETKQLSKAELIEQALSRMPQTRADAPFPVVMMTMKKTVAIKCSATESVKVNWGDETTTVISKGDYSEYTHSYSDDEPLHVIFLETSNDAIKYLNIVNNKLIFLDVTNNTNLLHLFFDSNDLDDLNLTGCQNLEVLWGGLNNLSSIDLTHLPHLKSLALAHMSPQFSEIDVSKNPELEDLLIGYNDQITNLDLTKNTRLRSIVIPGLPINTINNLSINAKSFAVFPKLEVLNVSNTPFTSLDFSDNPLMSRIYIRGTAITQLDISNLQIETLDLENSQLATLRYTSSNLAPNCNYVSVTNTPFEKLSSNVSPLMTALPNRNNPDDFGRVIQGQLYITSSAIVTSFLSYLKAKNWVVNPSDTYSVLPTGIGMDEYERLALILAEKN